MNLFDPRFLSAALAALLLAPPRALTAAPVIAEFLADNDLGLRDENGNDEDWIEIHNPDSLAVNLGGWHLSDDPLDPTKWTFPPRVLEANARLLVFASNKDRAGLTGNLHTNFRLDQDGDFLALTSPNGTTTSRFDPFPFQTKNKSFGTGFTGTLTTVDLTPTAFTAGAQYQRTKLDGIGAAQVDGSLNSFDDGLASPQHQQYLWYDYSSRLGSVPAGQTVVQATLEWSGTARIFAGVSGRSTVPGLVGVYPVPDPQRGVTSLAKKADGRDLIDYFAAHLPAAVVGYEPGRQQNFVWDITPLVRQWLDAPNDPTRGQFMLLTSQQPAWIAWDQNRQGPRLTVRTSTASSLTQLLGYMTPTPGAENSGVTPDGPLVRQLTENPPPPSAGTPLVIAARVNPGQGGALSVVQLTWRKMYEAEQNLTMTDDGQSGDLVAGDSIFAASIPATALEAGKMVRWKVMASDAAGYQTKMPPFRDSLDSPTYFGTVPVDPAITTNLPVLHWFMQTPSQAAGSGGRCSLFLNNEFYDNVGINIHGQSTSGGDFLKKSHDIDGNRGYRFKWSPDPTELRAKDLNLLTVYPDKTKVRHDLAYEMNRLAGVPAHYCFLTHVRQNGQFYGLLDIVEDGDDVFLERTGLNKDGALYKMYNAMSAATDAAAGAEKKNRKLENNADLQAFIAGLIQSDATARKNFLLDHVDVPKMINFMAGNSVTGNIDLHSKNYYVYRDTGRTNQWTLLPWDLDLSQGRLWTSTNNYFDDGLYVNPGGIGLLTGSGQNLVAKMYAIPEIREMAKRRVRTLYELFWTRTAVAPDPQNRWYDRRLLELRAQVGNDAVLDHTKWTPGPWKNAAPLTTVSPFRTNSMDQEYDRHFANYVVQRVNFVYTHPDMPVTQNLATLQPFTIPTIDASPASGNQDEEFIELRHANSIAVDMSGWRIEGGVEFTFEPGTVIPANFPGTPTIPASSSLYVSPNVVAFKARAVAPRGGQGLLVVGNYRGHLSNLGETIRLVDVAGTVRASSTYPGAPTLWQSSLVVSEVMYHPKGDGLAEYLEVANASTVTVPLTGVRFTQGIEFDFTGSAVTSLAPGARALVVRNLAAFQAAHGAAGPIAGVFANDSALDNSGDTVKLEDPSSNTIAEFTYSDRTPWPALPDGGGYSLVLINPASHPDPANPLNWRSSGPLGGSPGASDVLPWPGGDPSADIDGDGLPLFLELALGSNPAAFTAFDHLTVTGPIDGDIAVELVRVPTTDAVDLQLETSTSLDSWSLAAARLFAEERLPDGRTRQTWRFAPPSGGDSDHAFVRLKATLR